ncbi:MAG TPA: hypothetical protein VHF07_03450 [Nitrospiraceae bacterium]|nr:hypothetical protein [Nitrospiraceae bacterium]
MGAPTRVFAVDWSGDRLHAARKIWLAEVRDGELVRLENGRSREAIAEFFIEESKRDPRFIVGFDFCFSFPLWFCEELGVKTAAAIWEHVSLNGEEWIAACRSPFWGRRGTSCIAPGQRFRRTECDRGLRRCGAWPKSIFQIGGAGTVGSGSLRGMPVLAALREAGFFVWPFDPPGRPLVVEIYPRALTGPVNKSSDQRRRQYLLKRFPRLPQRQDARVSSSDDAFDAAVSALVMEKRVAEFSNLRGAADYSELLEGRIWY